MFWRKKKKKIDKKTLETINKTYHSALQNILTMKADKTSPSGAVAPDHETTVRMIRDYVKLVFGFVENVQNGSEKNVKK